jgi:hypothetical protein
MMKGTVALTSGTICLLASCLLASIAPGLARADDSSINTQCVVRGRSPAKAQTELFHQQKGGDVIALLPGASLTLRLTGFSKQPASGRVHVSTGTRAGYVRVDGWAGFDRFRFFSRVDLPTASASLWITQGQELSLTEVNGGKVTLEKSILGAASQTLKATVPCSDVTLEILTPTPDEPERARTYQMKSDTLELFDRAGGDAVFTLRMAPAARKVFWGTAVAGGFVHVLARSDVTVDAWARWRDLVPLGPHAEVSDPGYVAPRPYPPKTLALESPPTARTANENIPIHAKPANGTPIGAVQAGASFYPMQTSGEWTAVLPTDLAVLPPDNGGFWVRTSSLRK